MKIILLMFLFYNLSASAALVTTESFVSNTNKATSDMVWNIARGELHPPLIVIGYDDGSGAANYNFLVGDGSDGAFTSSANYASLSCSSISGTTITINTDSCQSLNFTEFHLQSGWVLQGVGAKPLVIRSLSTVLVDGTITCSGNNGSSGSSSYNSVNAGASSRCGGGSGGQSVMPAMAPSSVNTGSSGGGFVSGGFGGNSQDANGGRGGGGGGAYVKTFSGGADSADGTQGKDSTGANATAVGTNYRDDAFIDDLSGAGSGGGGGSAFQSGVDAGNSSGGSGGAGGGNLRIYAVGDVTINGSVLANGGDGGSVANPFKAGAGGGGGGGSILIMTVGDITNDGSVQAIAGSGGTAFSNAAGGNGYWGRTWLVEKDGYAGGGNLESPETKLNIPGDVRYETGITYTIESAAIDLGNSKPNFISGVANLVNQGGATLTFELAFGDSVSASSLSSYALPATYVGQDLGRFAKFRIQLDNLGATVPVTVSDIVLTYDGNTQQEFEFEGACGQVHLPPNSHEGPSPLTLMLFYLLPLILLAYLRKFTSYS